MSPLDLMFLVGAATGASLMLAVVILLRRLWP
jgi:hypothetical protein